MLRVALVFSFLFWCQCIEERYLLKYYYNVQVYWELALSGVANWRQSAGKRGVVLDTTSEDPDRLFVPVVTVFVKIKTKYLLIVTFKF
jgi:hypothetical protein